MPADFERKVLDAIDEQGTIDFLRQMIRSDSQNPPGLEKETALLIAEKLESIGVRVDLHEIEEGRPNVIGVIEGEQRDKLLFNGHLDTVKIGNAADWHYDPFGAEIEDGFIYGRGAADMKAGLAAMIAAMEALKKCGAPFKRGVLFTGVIDEEVHFKGTKALIWEGLIDDCRVGYVSEPTGLELVVRLKGGVEYAATTRGTPAHSGQAFLGENAIYKMARVVTALEDYNRELKTRMDLPGLRYPTVNVGLIRGGTGVTLVPDECRIEFDRQVLPGEDVVLAHIEVAEIVEGLRRDQGIDVKLDKMQVFNPWEISEDAPVVRALAEAFRDALGREPVYGGLNGYCDVELLAAAGIPAVVFGPGSIDRAHVPDERVAVREVLEAARVYALAACRFVTREA
jgi:acetylornithine deacetylase/succinyl-diaminopimelate desuccinylase family protein